MNRATPNLTAPGDCPDFRGDCPDFRAAKMGLSPSAPPSARPARGISLLEVLIAIFVVTIGLLGLVTLVPVGGFAVNEAAKADRSGACGRAALRQIKIQRMLDPERWAEQTGSNRYAPVPNIAATGPFAIDPLGLEEPAVPLGALGGRIPRITLLTVRQDGSRQPMPQAVAEQIFTWADDLQFYLPEDADPPLADESTRPRAVIDATGLTHSTGNYTWFITVTPAENEKLLTRYDQKRLYSVSVVVCYKRRMTPDENGEIEQVRTAVFPPGNVAFGGGSIRLAPPVETKEQEWIMLCDDRHCKWYRVASVGDWDDPDDPDDDPDASLLTLTGPDWDTGPGSKPPTAVIIDSVVGVYSTTVEL